MFSNLNSASTGLKLGYGALGIATCGLTYLCYVGRQTQSEYTKALLSSPQMQAKQQVNQRTKETVVYFASGLALTGALTGLMAKRFVNSAMNPLLMLASLPVTWFFMYKVYSTPQHVSTKPLYFLGFNTCMAFSLIPISVLIPMTVLKDAAVLTSGLMGGLGLVAYTSKDDAFLGWNGYLGAGLGIVLAASIANIFLHSPILNNIWLYGGLALFMAFTMHDVKEIQIRANKLANFDSMSESIKIYLDFINIFIRLAIILENRRKK